MNALQVILATVEPGVNAPHLADAWLRSVYKDAKERPHYTADEEPDTASVADIHSVHDLQRLDPQGYQKAKTVLSRTLSSNAHLLSWLSKRLSWSDEETVGSVMFYWAREDIVDGIQISAGRARGDHELHNKLVDLSNALCVVKLPDWDVEDRKFGFYNYGHHEARRVQATVEPGTAKHPDLRRVDSLVAALKREPGLKTWHRPGGHFSARGAGHDVIEEIQAWRVPTGAQDKVPVVLVKFLSSSGPGAWVCRSLRDGTGIQNGRPAHLSSAPVTEVHSNRISNTEILEWVRESLRSEATATVEPNDDHRNFKRHDAQVWLRRLAKEFQGSQVKVFPSTGVDYLEIDDRAFSLQAATNPQPYLLTYVAEKRRGKWVSVVSRTSSVAVSYDDFARKVRAELH